MKNQFSNFNDGYINIYNEKPDITDFNAKKNIKNFNNLDFVAKLAYEECSKRQQDLDFAESNGKTLTLKIKTRLIHNLNSNQKITIEDDLYDIIDIDYDKKKQEIYFYLERVRKIA